MMAEIRLAKDPRLETFVATLSSTEVDPAGARRFTEKLALALQASLLIRFGSPGVADAFCASRLAGDWGHTFGTLPRADYFDVEQTVFCSD